MRRFSLAGFGSLLIAAALFIPGEAQFLPLETPPPSSQGTSPGGSAAAVAPGNAAAPPQSVAALTAVQPSGQAGVHLTGEQLVSSALAQVERQTSISARLRQQATIGGRRVRGTGEYLQQYHDGQFNVLLRLQAEIGDLRASLLQVSSDGFLWIEQQVGEERQSSRIDQRALRRDTDDANRQLRAVVPGFADWSPSSPEFSAQHGGLPALLAGLHQNFQFSEPVLLQLFDEEVYATVGRWRPRRLNAIWPDAVSGGEAKPQSEEGSERRIGPSGDSQAGVAAQSTALQLHLERLPPHLPAEVLLLVDRDDHFPYVVEYREATSDPIRYQLSVDPLLLLVFHEVELNQGIDPSKFQYSARESETVDLTDKRLELQRRLRRERLAAMGVELPQERE